MGFALLMRMKKERNVYDIGTVMQLILKRYLITKILKNDEMLIVSKFSSLYRFIFFIKMAFIIVLYVTDTTEM